MIKMYKKLFQLLIPKKPRETKNVKAKDSLLAFYGLLDWWNDAFTEDERRYISKSFQPMGGTDLMGKPAYNASKTEVVNFLTALQGWFTTLADEVISEKILVKAESLMTDNTPVLDKNLLYNACIKHYYQKRNIDARYYNLAKEYCFRQIDLSDEIRTAFRKESGGAELPRIRGNTQIAIILEKEKAYKDAMTICVQAKENGWEGDWDKRIARLEKKVK